MKGERSRLFWTGRDPLVLASASPRRVALLRQVGAEFVVDDPGPDRAWPGEAEPARLARGSKRAAALRRADATAADTVVVCGVADGKPATPAEAAMLGRLPDTRDVWTDSGGRGREQRTAAERTRVSFVRLSPEGRSTPTSRPGSRSTRRAPTESREPRVNSCAGSKAITSTWSGCRSRG